MSTLSWNHVVWMHFIVILCHSFVSLCVKEPKAANRPKLPLHVGGKIPRNVRQRILDTFFDGFVEKGMDPQEAKSKVSDHFLIYYICSNPVLPFILSLWACEAVRSLVL